MAVAQDLELEELNRRTLEIEELTRQREAELAELRRVRA